LNVDFLSILAQESQFIRSTLKILLTEIKVIGEPLHEKAIGTLLSNTYTMFAG